MAELGLFRNDKHPCADRVRILMPYSQTATHSLRGSLRRFLVVLLDLAPTSSKISALAYSQEWKAWFTANRSVAIESMSAWRLRSFPSATAGLVTSSSIFPRRVSPLAGPPTFNHRLAALNIVHYKDEVIRVVAVENRNINLGLRQLAGNKS